MSRFHLLNMTTKIHWIDQLDGDKESQMLCKMSLRPKTWIQQSATQIRKLITLTHEVSRSTKGRGKHLRMCSKNNG